MLKKQHLKTVPNKKKLHKTNSMPNIGMYKQAEINK